MQRKIILHLIDFEIQFSLCRFFKKLPMMSTWAGIIHLFFEQGLFVAQTGPEEGEISFQRVPERNNANSLVCVSQDRSQ